MHVPEMLSDYGMFMFLYALMEMTASVANIIRIARSTYEFIYYTLLVDQGSVFFCDSQVISDLFACKRRLQLLINFCSQIAKLSANHVGRFLIFKWQRNSNGAVRWYLNWFCRMLEAIDSRIYEFLGLF